MGNFTELKPSIKDLFYENQPTEEQLLGMIADVKWGEGYVCRKCGHTRYCKGKRPHSRRCTRCKTEESALAHTIFHRCKIPLIEAFGIASAVCCNPDISTYELSRKMSKRQMTCWKFKTRIIECLSDPDKSATLRQLFSGFSEKTV